MTASDVKMELSAFGLTSRRAYGFKLNQARYRTREGPLISFICIIKEKGSWIKAPMYTVGISRFRLKQVDVGRETWQCFPTYHRDGDCEESL